MKGEICEFSPLHSICLSKEGSYYILKVSITTNTHTTHSEDIFLTDYSGANFAVRIYRLFKGKVSSLVVDTVEDDTRYRASCIHKAYPSVMLLRKSEFNKMLKESKIAKKEYAEDLKYEKRAVSDYFFIENVKKLDSTKNNVLISAIVHEIEVDDGYPLYVPKAVRLVVNFTLRERSVKDVFNDLWKLQSVVYDEEFSKVVVDFLSKLKKEGIIKKFPIHSSYEVRTGDQFSRFIYLVFKPNDIKVARLSLLVGEGGRVEGIHVFAFDNENPDGFYEAIVVAGGDPTLITKTGVFLVGKNAIRFFNALGLDGEETMEKIIKFVKRKGIVKIAT